MKHQFANHGKNGEFQRNVSKFRNFIKTGTKFDLEPNRYHLYVSYACPWANRCLATMYLKGLDNAVSLSIVHPTWGKTKPNDDNDTHYGWVFREEKDEPMKSVGGYGSFPNTGCTPDPNNGAKTIRELYEMAGDTGNKFTVPVLWDKKLKTIVNNESSEIIRIFNSEMNDLAKNPKIDLLPEELLGKIDEINKWVYSDINNGVYKCGFAISQEAYEIAFKKLFSSLDRVEEILSKSRFLCGNRITEADIRLFMTLVRFDEVYVVYFKCNGKRIMDYPNMRQYCRDIYQIPEIKKSINMEHIKNHYYTSHQKLNYYGIVPIGPNVLNELSQPHTRGSSKAEDIFYFKK